MTPTAPGPVDHEIPPREWHREGARWVSDGCEVWVERAGGGYAPKAGTGTFSIPAASLDEALRAAERIAHFLARMS